MRFKNYIGLTILINKEVSGGDKAVFKKRFNMFKSAIMRTKNWMKERSK